MSDGKRCKCITNRWRTLECIVMHSKCVEMHSNANFVKPVFPKDGHILKRLPNMTIPSRDAVFIQEPIFSTIFYWHKLTFCSRVSVWVCWIVYFCSCLSSCELLLKLFSLLVRTNKRWKLINSFSQNQNLKLLKLTAWSLI